MLLTSRKAVLALACLAGVCNGWRVRTAIDPTTAFNPAVLSHLSNPSVAHSTPAAAKARGHKSLSSPVMSAPGADQAGDRNAVSRRSMLAGALGAALFTGQAASADEIKFARVSPIQFIAAKGDPKASSGTGADQWGLWEEDPGPNGVYIKNYEKQLVARNGKAPAGWRFNESAWWVEEHGLIMPTPDKLPLYNYNRNPATDGKRYIVTGDRSTQAMLTVSPDGSWKLSKGTLYDVTHLPCRSAIYTPMAEGSCVPNNKQQKLFPVKPGAKMPKFEGCNTEDWAVLFVIGEEV